MLVIKISTFLIKNKVYFNKSMDSIDFENNENKINLQMWGHKECIKLWTPALLD